MTERDTPLTEDQRKILQMIEAVGFGKVVVTVKNRKPVYVETQKTIPLSGK